MQSDNWFYWQGNNLHLHIYLQPRASHDAIVGIHADCLKIRLITPPIDGKANKHLIKFLAHCFKVPAQQVIITHGMQSRKKWVSIKEPIDLGIINEGRFSQS